MIVLVLGSGGREHALCWKISQSSLCKKIYCIPGNAGIANLAQCIDININDCDQIINWASHNNIDLVVVGPELPLTMGIVDKLQQKNIKVFGPNKKAAQIEESKIFMKQILTEAKIPTAKYQYFSNAELAYQYLVECRFPIVIKADGLAAGKGVIICHTKNEAIANINDIMINKIFNEAGNQIIIEEYLQGEEISFFAITDGNTTIPLIDCQDHKRVGDDDTGPNTGGMGCYAPTGLLKKNDINDIMTKCILPALQTLKQHDITYTGILFAGLMLTPQGPKVLEYNIRFGDPECQIIMLLLASDLLPILNKASTGELSKLPEIKWHHASAICIVMAAQGYPNNYAKNTYIEKSHVNIEQTQIFHAGTKTIEQKLLSCGGRVLNVCAHDNNIIAAQKRGYKALKEIKWDQGFYRKDIGKNAIKRYHQNQS